MSIQFGHVGGYLITEFATTRKKHYNNCETKLRYSHWLGIGMQKIKLRKN